MRSRRVLAGVLTAAGSVLTAAVLVTAAQAAPAASGPPVDTAPATQAAPATQPQGEPSTFPVDEFTITHVATGLCLAGKAPTSAERTGAVVVEACDKGSDQKWTYDVASKRLRTVKLGVRWCLSAAGLAMERCPDQRSDTYRWLQDDGIYTPGEGHPRYLGVLTAADGANQLVLAAPDAAGRGFDWTVASTKPPPAPSPAPAPADEPAEKPADAPAPLPVAPPDAGAAPLPVAPPGADGLPLPAPGALPLPAPGALPLPAP